MPYKVQVAPQLNPTRLPMQLGQQQQQDAFTIQESPGTCRIIGRTLAISFGPMALLSSLMFVVALIISGLLSIAETMEDDGGGFTFSFADSLYFTFVTMTTVGFGDITPQTAVG